jgi:hypothetical protein
VESEKFDRLASKTAQRFGRRSVALGTLGGVLAHLGWTQAEWAEAGKKGKKKKKNKGMCTSAYGQKLRCSPSLCCDPTTSTAAACTSLGFPTCCASTGKAHPLGTTCCPSFYRGVDGVCTSDYPTCCTEAVGGGCCSAAYPVCCVYECCASWDYCAFDGFCGSSFARESGGAGKNATGKKLMPGDREIGAVGFSNPRQQEQL